MMSKTQKIWAWIFGAMFVVPEVLFLVIPSSIINYSNKLFLTLVTPFFDSKLFINSPKIFFVVLILELVGVLGLFVISVKSKKKLISVLLVVIFLWLAFLLFLAYISSSIRLLM